MGAPGCDDAPLIDVENALSVQRDITLIYPYYENAQFLKFQASHWMLMPDEFRTCVSVVIVDDASPRHPASLAIDWEPLQKALFNNVRVFRIHRDVRWNWLAARNIGAAMALDQWIALTDMDHVIPHDTLRKLVFGKFERSKIYRFSRREHTGVKIHPHPNSWFMTKEMYWEVGGYDEALSGFYGTDGEYRRRCAATAPIRIITDELERHEYQGDSSTVDYKRKQPEDAAVKRMIRARPADWKPKTLSFKYDMVVP